MPACDRPEEEHHHTEVSFISPVHGQVFPLAHANDIAIKMGFSTDGDHLEGIDISLFPSESADDPLLFHEIHEHEKTHGFEQNIDLSSFASGTVFTLQAAVCHDHECSEKELESITFRLE